MKKLVTTRLKYIFDDIFKGKTPIYSEEETNYIILGQRNNSKKGIDFNECKFTNEFFFSRREEKEFLKYGDIIINSLGGGTCGRVGFYDINDSTKVLTDGIPFILRNKKINKYYYYVLTSNQKRLEELALGATNQLSLKDTDLYDFKINILEDENYQQAVSDFLDNECKKIHAAIKNVEEEINKLDIYKRSLIIKVTTKGLSKARKFRHSNIDYIGEIPEDWNIHPVYMFFEEGKNKNSACKEQNLLSLSYGNIIRKDINTNGGLLPASFSTYNIVECGDIIIRPTDLQNDKKSLRTGLVKEHGIITSAYIDLQPKEHVNSHYFHYLLHAYDVMKVFYNMGNGVRQGLNYSEFAKLLLLCPSDNEQQEIVSFLDNKCSKIDSIIAKKKEQLELFESYKQSIIHEYVTGKKEVPANE